MVNPVTSVPGDVSLLEELCPGLPSLSESSREALSLVLERCIRCNTCKYSFTTFTPSCPSGEKHKWESYWASGRIRLARGLLLGKLEWTEDVLAPIFSCPTCGSCQVNCQAPHQDRIVDIIEALRELAVKKVGAPERQTLLVDRVEAHHNPYGEPNSDNEALKEKYNLPDQAPVVYFIGCTSNYRQQVLRDATLSVLKKLGVNFTLVDEYCCGSPLIRTGQVDQVPMLMKHNVAAIDKAGAETVITSCAGCYRTIKKDFQKFGADLGTRVLHTVEFLLPRLTPGTLQRVQAEWAKVTYHDPCHLAKHMDWVESPRTLMAQIPGLELVEMPRNRANAWCCGAGGGVKIGYPDWALEIAGERIVEAEETGATALVSTCPFCRTNLSDAAEARESSLAIVDLVEILDRVL